MDNQIKVNVDMNTILLFWNQADSSFDNEIFKMNIEEIEEANESNSVYSELYFDDYKLFVDSSQRVGAGNRFFVFCYGGNYCGIFCSGYLTSDYYEYEEQLNDGRLIGNLDLAPDYIIHPDYFQILTVDILKEAIPDIEWDDNVYGRFITKEQSQKIDSLWRDFLDKNSGIFVRWSAKQNYDFEFYLPQDEEIVHIGLSDEGKIKAHNYRCEIDIICDDINSAEEKAREIIENKYGNTKNIKFEYHYGFICNSDYTEKALRILMETCNGLKDDSGRPYIESVIKAARIDTLDGPRMLLMLLKLLDDGLITEEYLCEKALPESVLETIHILVNKDSESYESYIEKVSRNKQALNLMIDVLSDRLNIIYKYKELNEEDLEDLNKWLKAYHKLSEIRRSGLVSV